MDQSGRGMIMNIGGDLGRWQNISGIFNDFKSRNDKLLNFIQFFILV